MSYVDEAGNLAKSFVELARSLGYKRVRNHVTVSGDLLSGDVSVQKSAYGPLLYINVQLTLNSDDSKWVRGRSESFLLLTSGGKRSSRDSWPLAESWDEGPIAKQFDDALEACTRTILEFATTPGSEASLAQLLQHPSGLMITAGFVQALGTFEIAEDRRES